MFVARIDYQSDLLHPQRRRHADLLDFMREQQRRLNRETTLLPLLPLGRGAELPARDPADKAAPVPSTVTPRNGAPQAPTPAAEGAGASASGTTP